MATVIPLCVSVGGVREKQNVRKAGRFYVIVNRLGVCDLILAVTIDLELKMSFPNLCLDLWEWIK